MPAPVLSQLVERVATCMAVDRHRLRSQLERVAVRLAGGDPCHSALAEVTARLEASAAEAARRAAIPITLTYPELLPVAAHRAAIAEVLRQHRSFVLTGETGSGKTTQLPKMLLEAGFGRRGLIAVTQPRRVAAFAIAARLREETGAPESVIAHSVRFDDRAGPDTLVRVMTDGLLLAELEGDPRLSRYDALMIDEAHERSLTIDLLLGLVRRLREQRPDLLVAVSSASIEAERFATYLGTAAGPAPIVAVAGRTFPVEIRWREPADQDVGYLGAVIEAVRELHRSPERGDCLCFLPTERDILDAARRLRDLPGASVLPLFSRLTPGEQQRVFKPAPGRKVVLTTNIAETSLTIPGIRYVVDSGLARIKRYQASSRTERLPIEAVSQASCLQRAGRAGRVEAGVCIRLFSEEDFARREPFVTPEIQRSNLAGVLLSCLSAGIDRPEEFPWLDAPAPHAWRQARSLLEELGALASTDRGGVPGDAGGDAHPSTTNPAAGSTAASERLETAVDAGRSSAGRSRTSDAPGRGHHGLTGIGRAMAAIPADPQVARILLAGIQEGVAHEASTIAAFLSVQDPRVRPVGLEAKADGAHRDLAHEAGDLASILVLWDRYQGQPSNSARARWCDTSFLGFRRMREWADVRHQLWASLRASPSARRSLPVSGHPAGDWPLERIHRSVLAGMLGNVLMYDRKERCYRGAGDRLLHVHPGSALRSGKAEDGKKAPPPPPWLVACEVVETSRLFARICAPIDPEWVVQLAGERVKRRYRQPHYHHRRQQVLCTETVTWKGLPVRDGRLVPYERVNPSEATAIFIREGCAAEGSALAKDPALRVLAENQALVLQARRLAQRLRDPTMSLDQDVLERFYRDRLGASPPALRAPADGATSPSGSTAGSAQRADARSAVFITSSDSLRRYLAAHGPARVRLALSDLVPEGSLDRAERDFPDQVEVGGRRLPLEYCFAPGDERDGATIQLSQQDLATIDPTRITWMVPGWIPAMVESWLQSLPKEQRRELIPLAGTARSIASRLRERSPAGVALGEAVQGLLQQEYGMRSAPLGSDLLPSHCRLRFSIRDSDGTVTYEGRDPELLHAQALAAPDRLAVLRRDWQSAPGSTWPGDCPGAVSAQGVRGYVALARCRDEARQVAAQRAIYASAEAAAVWHEDGLDALLEAACAAPLEAVVATPLAVGATAQIEAALGTRVGLLRRQLGLAILVSVERQRITTQPAWDDLLNRAQAALVAGSGEIDRLLLALAHRVEPIRRRLKQGAKSLTSIGSMHAVEDGLERLLGPGWPQRMPWASLMRSDTFLAGYERLLEIAQTRGDEARRLVDRMSGVMAAWDEALGGDGPRWAAALGLTRRLRELGASREDCLLGLTTAGTGSGVGWAEGRWRESLSEFAKRIQTARKRAMQDRSELLALRPVLGRFASPRRERVQAELDRLIADLPDLSWGADLVEQQQRVAAMMTRIRAG